MMILFELLPKKSNLQLNLRPTLLETLACRQQKWKQKIASSRKHGIKREKPQGAISFRSPRLGMCFSLFYLPR